MAGEAAAKAASAAVALLEGWEEREEKVVGAVESLQNHRDQMECVKT